MMNKYEPELGQALFGQPYKNYDVDGRLETAISTIRYYLVVSKGMNFIDPFSNSGGDFTCDAFEVQAYSWNDEVDQPYNFKWRDLQVSWYKYFGRGMSASRKVKWGELLKMVDECIDAIRAAKTEDK